MSAKTYSISLNDIELQKQQKTAELQTSVSLVVNDDKVYIRDERRKDIVKEHTVSPSDRLNDYFRASIDVGSDDTI